MYRILALLTLVLSFSAAQAASHDAATEVANALVDLAKHGTELGLFAKDTSAVTSVDVKEHANGDATIAIKGHEISNHTLCAHSQLLIERTTVEQFFGPVTVYTGKTTVQKICP